MMNIPSILSHFIITCLFLGWSLEVVSAGMPPSEPIIPQSIPELEKALSKILWESKVPGMGMALVSREKIIWVRGIGLADVAQKKPATANTLFRIASVSKGFVALAALQLRAQGKLDFSATLRSLAPEIEFKNPWEATDPVRIVHLLEHTTGFEDSHLCDFARQDPLSNNLKEALAFDPDSRISRWPPGERFAYCNTGTAMVAYVIQKITGQPFETYIEEHIFRPLSMNQASYFLTPKVERQLSKCYHADGVRPFPYDHAPFRADWAINASPNELANYVRMYLQRGQLDGKQIVSEADIERMEMPSTTPGAQQGLKVGYGLYNYSYTQNGFVFHGHDGGIYGALTRMAYLPTYGVGYIFTINAGNGEPTKK
jgi:CubicO group peptidase (beta-lactamase class C family)